MHACDLVQLATVIAAHGDSFVEGAQRVSASSLNDYWTASRCRFDRWGRILKEFTSAVHRSRSDAAQAWPEIRPVIEEILLSEILTRVWGGVLFEHDRRLGVGESDPISRSIMMGHLEARHRTLALLLHGPGVGTVAAVELNRLRNRVERWIDMLIGGLLQNDAIEAFAVDPERAREFAAETNNRQRNPLEHHAWQLTLASLQAAFRPQREHVTPNTDVNERIAAAIVACFPAELFDSTGVFRSLWVTRLTNGTQDAQGLIDELVRMEYEPMAVATRAKRF